jgi:hypothetical protein
VPTSDKVPGVPEFVAPEQVEGRPVDQRSNLYSLGALYYYVLTGQPVFAGAPDQIYAQHQKGTIRPPSQLVQISPQVEAVIMRALDRSPTKRFLTVRQFVDEVTRVGHGEVIELKQTIAMGKAGRPKGELVQTLMGIHKSGGLPVAAGSGTAPLGSGATAAPRPAQAATVVGMASTDRPAGGQPMPTSPAGPVGMTALTPPPMAPMAPVGPMAPQAPSPWAPPMAASPQQPTQVAPPQVAPPMVAAPVLAAPVVASVQAAAPAGKKKSPEDAAAKGKFRETMWFKKGELDAQAAQVAAEEAARTGKTVDNDKADSLPIDERYKDDGSITRGDKEKYSLRTGATVATKAVRDSGSGTTIEKVSEDALIGEMKSGRNRIIAAVAIGLVVVALIIFLIVR